MKGEHCEVCGIFVEGFEYKMCCSGFDCGCGGLPVEPCICSEKCWEKVLNDGPEFEDGPWAEGWDERCGNDKSEIKHGNRL